MIGGISNISRQQDNWEVSRENARIQGNYNGREGIDREKIIVIGESMIKYVDKIVGMDQQGSCKRSIRGAGIKQTMGEAIEAAEKNIRECQTFYSRGWK